jgi:hypothetical protein
MYLLIFTDPKDHEDASLDRITPKDHDESHDYEDPDSGLTNPLSSGPPAFMAAANGRTCMSFLFLATYNSNDSSLSWNIIKLVIHSANS